MLGGSRLEDNFVTSLSPCCQCFFFMYTSIIALCVYYWLQINIKNKKKLTIQLCLIDVCNPQLIYHKMRMQGAAHCINNFHLSSSFQNLKNILSAFNIQQNYPLKQLQLEFL